MEKEAKKYATILGYNYNSSKWYEQSYKILNKEYKIIEKQESEDEKNFIQKILKKLNDTMKSKKIFYLKIIKRKSLK